MPELPEVETLVCDLRPHVVGRKIVDAQVFWPRTIHGLSPDEFRERLIGRRIATAVRRAKFLVFKLESDERNEAQSVLYLLIHLRMSGQLLFEPLPPTHDSHIRVVFAFDDGRKLYFRDMRKFGRVYLTSDLATVIGDLGPEPLADDFDCEALAALLRGRRGMIKPLLLNQRLLAGVGNIYADEALFIAGLDPRRQAQTLMPEEIARLCAGIRQALQQGICNRGTTLDDFRDANGCPGNNQDNLQAPRQAGRPCSRCGAPIQRIVVGGRGSYFCANCQK
jgi:formamidopyrimidine-DNA glycosylase